MTGKINSWHLTVLIATGLAMAIGAACGEPPCRAPNVQRAVVRYDPQRLSCPPEGACSPEPAGWDVRCLTPGELTQAEARSP